MEAKVGNQTYEIPTPVAIRKEVLRIGDRVSLLEKNAYSEPKIHDGVIIGFEPFESLPTVRVAFIEVEYDAAKVRTIAINEKNDKYDMVPSADTAMRFDYQRAVMILEKQVAGAELLLSQKKEQLQFFKIHWGSIRAQANETANEDVL